MPRPEKTNEKMAYYDESCIDRLRTIQELKEKRFFPLHLIKNILRRMDEGLNLTEAESIENAVFGAQGRTGNGLLSQTAFLAATGLSEKELKEAQRLGILIPCTVCEGKPLYNQEDVRVGRDGIKKFTRLGMNLGELSFWMEIGKKIIDKEMKLRRKIVAGKSTRQNIAITAELTQIGNFYRDYILRRLFQKQVEDNIQKSLAKRRKTAANNNRPKA